MNTISSLHGVTTGPESAAVDLAKWAPPDPAQWVACARRASPQFAERIADLMPQLPTVVPASTKPASVLHGDLHDKNLIWQPNGEVAVIDLDAMMIGPREVDVANLSAHIALRAIQRGESVESAGSQASGLARYEHWGRLDTELVDALLRHTWFRLAVLYWLRPNATTVVPALLELAIR